MIEQIIENFLCDLGQCVNGSNGSDERSMAAAYFRRGYYGGTETVTYAFERLNWIHWQWYSEEMNQDLDWDKHNEAMRIKSERFRAFEQREIQELLSELPDLLAQEKAESV
jgi:hypothetical protein